MMISLPLFTVYLVVESNTATEQGPFPKPQEAQDGDMLSCEVTTWGAGTGGKRGEGRTKKRHDISQFSPMLRLGPV